jgi:hypothetical protein
MIDTAEYEEKCEYRDEDGHRVKAFFKTITVVHQAQ